MIRERLSRYTTSKKLVVLLAAMAMLLTLAGPAAAAGPWSVGPSLISDRSTHTATLLANGKVLVVGGTGDGVALASAELYDPATKSWSPAASMAVARYQHTATLLANGKVLVAGGVGASAEIYDPIANSWSPAGSMSVTRTSGHQATLLGNDKVLVTGGYTDGPSFILNSADLYDPVSNSWSAGAPMNTARTAHTATQLSDGTVLVASGRDSSSYTTSSEVYDPTTGSWSATAGPLSSARQYHQATLLGDGTVLVSGGNYGNYLDHASSELYDPATKTWSATGSLATARYIHTASLLSNGRVLVTGGFSTGDWGFPESNITSAELYDPATMTWSSAGSTSVARVHHTSTTLAGGDVLVAGGGNSPGSTELYDDADHDLVGGATDNCPGISNPGQANADGDSEGDVCDENDEDGPTGDLDGDGSLNEDDAFDNDPNETTDSDDDGTGDNADAFDNDPNETVDSDGDGTGNNADAFDDDANETTDSDGDGTGDNADGDDTDGPTGDSDGDGVLNGDGSDPNDDNCPSVANADQDDSNEDGRGDLCEETHERSITLSLKHVKIDGERKLKLSGNLAVADGAAKCGQDRRIFLERYNPKTARWVSIVEVDRVKAGDGDYAYNAPDKAAKYRASVKDRNVRYNDFVSVCSAASTSKRHSH